MQKFRNINNKFNNFLKSRQYRAQLLLRFFGNKRLHQTTILTGYDRYPALFAAAAAYLSEHKRPRILSFGCSTGEEVDSLRCYFPNSEIVGAEINPYCLQVCRARQEKEGISFIESSPRNIFESGPYDAIFCMAVLQRTPHLVINQGLEDISSIYPFHKFEQQLSILNNCLNKNGILIIEFSQYQFMQTCLSDRYVPLNFEYTPPTSSLKFDKTGRLDRQAPCDEVIFVKQR